jgi:hypothetical protein
LALPILFVEFITGLWRAVMDRLADDEFIKQDRRFSRCRLTAHTPIDRLLKRVDKDVLADKSGCAR